MIRIAQASQSEYHDRWGVPGNQLRTGVTEKNPVGNMDGELNTRAFYRYNWKAVFRPKDPAKAEKIAWLAERAVMNWRYFGYGNYNADYPREGVFDTLMQMPNPDPYLASTLANCDCASLAGACVYFGGVYEPRLRTMNTSTETEILMGTGDFIRLTDRSMLETGAGLQRGDILLYRETNGHTCIVIEADEPLALTPKETAQCAFVNLRSGPSTNYDVIETLPGGEVVWYISEASTGWIQVRHGNNVGYIAPQYLADLMTLPATGNTWLRKGPGKDADTIIVIPRFSTAYYLGEKERVGTRDWLKVAYAGREGWASSLYLS